MAPRETSPSNNKRKRGGADQGAPRPSPAVRAVPPPGEDSSAQSAYDESSLSQIIAHNNGSLHNGPNTSVAAETAAAALTHYQVPPSFEPGAQPPSDPGNPFALEHTAFGLDQLKEAGAQAPHTPQQGNPQTPASNKPAVGSDEWHRVRRDNHKEVERRRREAINEGINELSKIVPGCEKNKGAILQRAVQYIGQLKENEQQNIEKWTLEKLLLDQAITELSATAERLKNDSKFYQRERDIYKRACEEHSVVPPELKELESEAKGGAED